MSLLPTDSSLYFSKKDPQDPRLGDWAEGWTQSLNSLAESTANFALFGAPDDDGISLNGGRIGASLAPKQIRTIFYKMTPHVLSPDQQRIIDLGDVDTRTQLADRHEKILSVSQNLTKAKIPWVMMGGGHDYGYPNTAGFVRAHLQDLKTPRKPIVINFDAHLDVRPTDRGYNSGTPFFRLLEEFGSDIHFLEVGLQPQCNSRFHWDWALSKGATLIPLSKVNTKESLSTALKNYLSDKKDCPIFLSLDIDAITSNEAPGCSQSWTTGLKTDHLLSALSEIYQHHPVGGFGIYEVSPSLDQDNRTSKLAALFMHHYLFAKANI